MSWDLFPDFFILDRLEDATGVSGTGEVAWGCRFPDGTCVLRWATEHRSTAVYDSIETLEAIHGHGGSTVIRWWTEDSAALLAHWRTQARAALDAEPGEPRINAVYGLAQRIAANS